MTKRRSERGLTLIEILLALIVMVLGVLGILALFPPALQSSIESVHDTQAGVTAESVAHAFNNAIRQAQWDGTKQEWTVLFTHDLRRGTTSAVKYSFKLPKLNLPGNKDWKHHPGDTVAGILPDSAEKDTFFNLGGDPWVSKTVDDVAANDPSEAYKKFGFSFDVRKINTLEYLWPGSPTPINPATGLPYTQQDVEALVKLYEFRIHIFRLAQGQTADDKRLIATLTDRVSVK